MDDHKNITMRSMDNQIADTNGMNTLIEYFKANDDTHVLLFRHF